LFDTANCGIEKGIARKGELLCSATAQ
jgi:hypothetical protein